MPRHDVREFMSRDRFDQIRRYFHICEYTEVFPGDEASDSQISQSWEKMLPLAKVIRNNSQASFLPGRDMTVDEMMIGFKGRSKVSLESKEDSTEQEYKIFALCYKGYTMNFRLHSRTHGTQEVSARATDETKNFCRTSRCVYDLCVGLPFDRHFFVIYMDNYFSNVELFATLRKAGIGAVGAARVKTKLFPEELNVDKKKAIELLPWNSLVGKVVKPQIPEITRPFADKPLSKKRPISERFTTENVNVLGWNDNGLIHMMTTVHTANQNQNDQNTYIIKTRRKPGPSSSNYATVALLFAKGRHTAELPTPIVVDDYDHNMDAVDITDQLRSYYYTPFKNYRNWFPIFFWLLDTSIINSYLLFITQFPHRKTNKSPFDFRFALSRCVLEEGKKELENQVLQSSVPDRASERQEYISAMSIETKNGSVQSSLAVVPIYADDGTLDIKATYLKVLEDDPEITMPVAAIESLVVLLSVTQTSTSSELIKVLADATSKLKKGVLNSVSLTAGCDLFTRFVLRNINDMGDWEACKAHLMKNGRLFAQRAKEARKTIAHNGLPFIRDDDVILVHAHSRAVISLLLLAASKLIRFRVYVTESRVTENGYKTAEILRNNNIPVCLIADATVGYVIQKVDKIFVGAEGVAESGGVINASGTYQIGVLAKDTKVPFYVVAESHKFVRLYPVSPSDIATDYPLEFTTETRKDELENLPTTDFTPHQYVTALITDIGVLTTSGVSEELIKIYV